MSPALHSSLLSAFLAGKSCSAIALAFNLSVEEVLTWFESDLTQSTLRRLEALQLQQARIVSFSVLPHAAGSLTNTCESADNPALRTRAASNLVRLGLRFTTPSRTAGALSPREGVGGGFISPADRDPQTSRISEAPSPWEGVGGGFDSLSNLKDQTSRSSEAPSPREGAGGSESIPADAPAAAPTNPSIPQQFNNRRRSSHPASHSPPATSTASAPSAASDPYVPSASPNSRSPLACELLRSEFAALRTAAINPLELNPLPTLEAAPPLFSRHETRVSSLSAFAGAVASRGPVRARTSSPPQNLHPPPLVQTAA